MKRNYDEVQESRSRRARRVTRPGDDGVGLMEIMVAFAVFMICFVPLLQLLPAGPGSSPRAQTSVWPPPCPTRRCRTTRTRSPRRPSPPPATSRRRGSRPPARRRARAARPSRSTRSADGAGPRWPRAPARSCDGPASYHIVIKVGWGRGLTNSSVANVVVDSTELSSVTGHRPRAPWSTSARWGCRDPPRRTPGARPLGLPGSR